MMEKSQFPRSPFPAQLAVFLDNPLRRLIINRKVYLEKMGIKEGDRVFEIGCGPGFFTEAIADIVGDNGVVFAQDVEEKMIEKVKRKIKARGLKNVETLLCNSSSTNVEDGFFDVLFCANVLEEIYYEGEIDGSLKEMDRCLRKGGLFIIKEHRLGGTNKVVMYVEGWLKAMDYKKLMSNNTFLSYNILFQKGVM